MGRSLNIEIPCSVSIDELAHDRGLQEFSAEDLKEARLELADELATGPKLWAVLQEWLNVDATEYDERLRTIARLIGNMLNGCDEDRPAPYEDRISNARADAGSFVGRMVNEYITSEMVDERAEKIAADRLEDAL